jgi:hypothetical protein
VGRVECRVVHEGGGLPASGVVEQVRQAGDGGARQLDREPFLLKLHDDIAGVLTVNRGAEFGSQMM